MNDFFEMIHDRPLLRVDINNLGDIEIMSWAISAQDATAVEHGTVKINASQVDELVRVLRRAQRTIRKGASA